MNKIITLTLALLGTAACLTAGNNDKEDLVKKAVADRNLTIVVRTVFPQSGDVITPSTDYTLQIKDGKLDGTLPFFGTSYTSVMPNDDQNIRFENCPVDIRQKDKKKETQLSFTANSGDDRWQITLRIFDNGNISLNCLCPSKSQMNYSGILDLGD